MRRGRRLSLSLFFLLRPIILRPGWRGSYSPKTLPGVAFLAFRRSSQRCSAVPLIKPSLLKVPPQPVSSPLPFGCNRQVPAGRLPARPFLLHWQECERASEVLVSGNVPDTRRRSVQLLGNRQRLLILLLILMSTWWWSPRARFWRQTTWVRILVSQLELLDQLPLLCLNYPVCKMGILIMIL